MIYHFTFDWPQIIVTSTVFISFVGSCFKSAKQTNLTDGSIVLIIGFLWMLATFKLLSAGGFYG